MASRTWTTSFRRFTSAALLVGAIALVGDVGLRDRDTDACGFFGPTLSDVTTFDPGVLGDPDGLDFQPWLHGFGGTCDDCGRKAMLADWGAFLKEAVSQADWSKVLFEATPQELEGLKSRLAGKTTTAPKGFEKSSLWAVPGAKDKLRAAIDFVILARAIEPVAMLSTGSSSQPPLQLVADAKLGWKSAREPFLAQRYALQALRVMFFRRDWPAAIAFFDKNKVALDGPSTDIAARAHYYLAGALRRNGNLGRANLEFARVFTASKALAGAAAEDFQPMEEADWRESLKLAKTPRERAELWQLVGVTKRDGFVAINEIMKLDPKSDLFGLLIVREMARAESAMLDMDPTQKPDPKIVKSQNKAFAQLAQIAQKLAATPGADRPWLMALVLGHLAAKHGDVATARSQMRIAVTARPTDVHVTSQAKASLALALAIDYKIDPAREDEIAQAMNSLDKDFGRRSSVNSEVRGALAKVYAKAGRIVDGEFLHPGTADPTDDYGNPVNPKAKLHWVDAQFIKDMIARTAKVATAFDRFVLDASFNRQSLEKELAFRTMMDGDPAGALAIFAAAKRETVTLHTDPFVIHIRDCHDCDHEKYDKAPWTHANFLARLVELQKAANGKGQAAADAALALGNAYYNVTYYGNARVVFEDTHQETRDTRPAERWYKRAFELGSSREFKAKAAFLAAKAELGRLMAEPHLRANDPNDTGGLPVAKQWFTIEKGFKDTQYYKDALKECGAFSDFILARP